MTPKAKAEELYDKYDNHTALNLTLDGAQTLKRIHSYIKQCVLITVEEILFALKMDINDPTAGSVKYWEQVKQEIEGL